ncbi:MAG: hypothetical protein LBS32_07590 [Clostridiales Family XIII bacterium]|jgi:hypothetical protein|nr:hypothetical protein [Clostridiales Family XIII bacterium]
MTLAESKRIDRYRLVYRYAKDEGVKLNALTNDIDNDEATLIDRINEKARKRDKYAQPITLDMIVGWYS